MNGKLVQILASKATTTGLFGAGAFSLGVAVGIGYALYTEKRNFFDEEVEVQIDIEVDDPQLEFEFVKHNTDEPVTPEMVEEIMEAAANGTLPEEIAVDIVRRQSVAEHLAEQLGEELENDAQEILEVQVVQEEVLHDIFANKIPGWDYTQELEKRKVGGPFVIHEDEFRGDEFGWDQSSLTYYAGDDILVDENKVPIYNPLDVIGEYQFGHGSSDPDVFHARNTDLRGEYEVTRVETSYAIDVLDLQTEEELESELQHSTPMKFRIRD